MRERLCERIVVMVRRQVIPKRDTAQSDAIARKNNHDTRQIVVNGECPAQEMY